LSVGTAFHPRTSALNSTMAWGEWSGYFAAAVYADFHDIEYNAIREQAALIDVTPLYKYEIAGPDAARLVDRVVSRDVSKRPGDRRVYTPGCHGGRKVVDDGTFARRG
jgi:aminomethyltransferase